MHSQTALVAALLGLVLIFALLQPGKAHNKANRLLAGSLFCALCYLLGLTVWRAQWLDGQFIRPLISAHALSPVLLLAYVRSLIQPGFALRRQHALHLLPMLGIFLLLPGSDQISLSALEQARGGWPPNTVALIGIIGYLIQLGYFGRAAFELRQHRQQQSQCTPQRSRSDWMLILLQACVVLAAIGLLVALLRLLPGVELWPRSVYSMSMVLAQYFLIAFIGLTQPAMFLTPLAAADTTITATTPTITTAPAVESSARYSSNSDQPAPGPPVPRSAADTSTADTSTADTPGADGKHAILPSRLEAAYWHKLQQHMEQQRPFLQSQLRIADLAEQLDIPAHHLSQTINRRAKQSFPEFINQYRVNAAKAMIENSSRSIVSIAFDAGFNSESAFYRHFKTFTGKTPTQHRNDLRSENS